MHKNKNNQIFQGLLTLDNNLNLINEKLIDIKVKFDENKKNNIITLNYHMNYYKEFDFLIDINKSLDILKEINLERITNLNLSNIGLKNIDFLLNKSLTILEALILNNNNIDDINIFKDENIFVKILKYWK